MRLENLWVAGVVAFATMFGFFADGAYSRSRLEDFYKPHLELIPSIIVLNKENLERIVLSLSWGTANNINVAPRWTNLDREHQQQQSKRFSISMTVSVGEIEISSNYSSSTKLGNFKVRRLACLSRCQTKFESGCEHHYQNCEKGKKENCYNRYIDCVVRSQERCEKICSDSQ